MPRHYTIFVEFAESIDGRSPVTQSLEVYTAEREFSVLLEALDASPFIVELKVYNKSQVTGHLTRLYQQDLTTAYKLSKLVP